jgi:cytochrome c-type biogenesis protein CcmH
LEQGQSKGEILQFFVERYGETILAAPVKSGFSLIAWLAPVTVIIAGGIVIWLAIRKWVKGEKESFPEPVTSLPDSTYDEEYRRQLEKELKVFDKKGYR